MKIISNTLRLFALSSCLIIGTYASSLPKANPRYLELPTNRKKENKSGPKSLEEKIDQLKKQKEQKEKELQGHGEEKMKEDIQFQIDKIEREIKQLEEEREYKAIIHVFEEIRSYQEARKKKNNKNQGSKKEQETKKLQDLQKILSKAKATRESKEFKSASSLLNTLLNSKKPTHKLNILGKFKKIRESKEQKITIKVMVKNCQKTNISGWQINKYVRGANLKAAIIDIVQKESKYMKDVDPNSLDVFYSSAKSKTNGYAFTLLTSKDDRTLECLFQAYYEQREGRGEPNSLKFKVQRKESLGDSAKKKTEKKPKKQFYDDEDLSAWEYDNQRGRSVAVHTNYEEEDQAPLSTVNVEIEISSSPKNPTKLKASCQANMPVSGVIKKVSDLVQKVTATKKQQVNNVDYKNTADFWYSAARQSKNNNQFEITYNYLDPKDNRTLREIHQAFYDHYEWGNALKKPKKKDISLKFLVKPKIEDPPKSIIQAEKRLTIKITSPQPPVSAKIEEEVQLEETKPEKTSKKWWPTIGFFIAIVLLVTFVTYRLLSKNTKKTKKRAKFKRKKPAHNPKR